MPDRHENTVLAPSDPAAVIRGWHARAQQLLSRLILALVYAGWLAGAAVANAQDNPPSFDQQFQSARGLAFAGKRDAAVAAYTELLRRSPGNADVLLGRGRFYTLFSWSEPVRSNRNVCT